MKAGILLSKIDKLRDVFEESGYSLCSSTHLRQLIPFFLLEEKPSKRFLADLYKSYLMSLMLQRLLCSFYGLLKIGLLNNGLVGLMLIAKSVTGGEVTRLLVEDLSTELGISSHFIITAMHARLFVNLEP